MFEGFKKALRLARIGTVYNGLMATVSISLFHSCFFACFFMTLFIYGIIVETLALYEWDEN